MEKVILQRLKQKNISLALAQKMLEAALAKAKEMGINFAITIVDRVRKFKSVFSNGWSSCISSRNCSK